MLIHWPDRFYHSSYDTPDRLDPRALELTARCAATYALFLAGAGAAEADWLLGLVARGARRRWLAAADTGDAARAMARERVRGAAALGSLSRLGIDDDRVAQARTEFERFAEREAPGAVFEHTRTKDLRIPRRLKRGPLDFLDHLNPGWAELDDAAHDAWRALAKRCPEPCLELAWFAADGRRTLGEIAELVTLETGACSARDVGGFFDLAERMGLIAWRDGEA